MHPTKFGVSQGLTRKEDDALIRGQGHYVADVTPDGTLHAVVLRSAHAHAGFRIIGTTAARGMPGVHLVLTGSDVADLGGLPCVAIPEGVTVNAPPYPILARDEVRHVGDAVAFVVADTVAQAKDAAEAILIEWEARPHVVSAVAALAPGAPPVWPSHADNVAFRQTLGDETATAAALASAARTVTLAIVNQRLVTNYLDTRAVVAEYDKATDRTTLTLGSQGSHLLRDLLSQAVLKIPPEKLRVITPDVGGGFGTKLFPYREYALAAVAAKRLKRPVKWVADRTEHFLGDTQGRDNVTTATLALDADNRFTALSIDMVCDMGAYLSAFAPYIPYVGAVMLPGVYDFPACHIRITAAFTNTLPVDAYRGAGRPEAAYLIERLVDTAARDIGIAPEALRKRNFIKPKAMPYTTPTQRVYNSGDFAGHMARAQDIIDWKGFWRRAAQSKKTHRLRGIGLATYIEACGSNGPDAATVRLDRDGNVTVLAGSQSTGQGHATAYAQLVAEHLDLPPERVTVIQGDTDLVATGAGTGGSSSITCGGASVDSAARKLAANLKALAAHELEASEADLEIADGQVRIAGTDRAVSFAAVASSRLATPDLLDRQGFRRPAAADLPQRHPYRGSRDRPGHRAYRYPRLCDRQRFRRHPQSAAACRPSPWRRRAGHRPGYHGEHRLRRQLRTTDHRLADGLRAAAGRGRACVHVRDPQCALRHQSARRQGRGRGRHHRGRARRHERRHGRTLPRLPHPPPRHAGNAGAGVGGAARGRTDAYAVRNGVCTAAKPRRR